MKNLASLSLASVFSLFALSSLAALATGCSSSSSDPFGPDPDYASVQARFTAPSGTISDHNLSSVFAQYTDQRNDSATSDLSGATSIAGGSSSSNTDNSMAGAVSKQSQGLHFLTDSSGITAKCSALAGGNLTGNCSCPDGGSFDYDFSSFGALTQSTGPIDASLKVRFDSCVSTGITIDGKEFVHIHADRNGSTIDEKSLSVLLVADFTVTTAGQSHLIDIAAVVSDGQYEIAVQVDDGWVTVRSNTDLSGTEGYVVRDRNATWTCSTQNGTGACQDGKGNSHKF